MAAVELYRIKMKGDFMYHTIGLESHFSTPTSLHASNHSAPSPLPPPKGIGDREGGGKGRMGGLPSVVDGKQAAGQKTRGKNQLRDDSIGLSRVMRLPTNIAPFPFKTWTPISFNNSKQSTITKAARFERSSFD